MQVEIDFEVFKALTNLRQSESDSYNSVIRRLLKLSDNQTKGALAAFAPVDAKKSTAVASAFIDALRGAWFNNIHFPEGTQFRATYKGQLFVAEIKNGQWIGHDGISRTSPSEAAGAISGTNVNGWRFWFAKRPGDPDWKRMDEFKK